MPELALQTQIKETALEMGADLCGFADLEPLSGWIEENYGQSWNGYLSAVTLSVNMPRDIVHQLLDGPTLTYDRYYETVNLRIDSICLRISSLLEKAGFLAFPVPASQRMGATKLSSIFSHRLAAHQGGLGWIGKNCSLIRPDRGPLHRLGTVLTDAPFQYGAPMNSQCGSCRACMEICPAQALKGVRFEDAQELEARFDAPRCQKHFTETRKSFGKEICGLCIAVCPYGKRKE